ncbi:hypothetical protein ABG067_008209, partial [Albugo candida]
MVESNKLMSTMEEILKVALPSNQVNNISLPTKDNVKKPGRPQKDVRWPSSRKDYDKPEYRKNQLLFGKSLAKNKLREERSEIKENQEDEDATTFKVPKRRNPASATIKLPLKRKMSTQHAASTSYAKEDLYKPTTTRKPVINVASAFAHMLNANIDCEQVKEVYNPEGDGYCGYRAIAYLRYGDEEQYPQVKKDMLKTFNEYRSVYSVMFGADVLDELEENIKRGMDPKPKGEDVPKWFISPYCSQVVADAYKIPV